MGSDYGDIKIDRKVKEKRGKDILAAYEGDDVSSYDFKKQQKDPFYLRYLQKIMYIAQMVVLAGGVLCAVGAYLAENQGWAFAPHGIKFGLMENELIFIPYICGGCSLITAVIGFIGAKLYRKASRSMITMYLIFVSLSLVLAVASASQAFADIENVYYYAQRQWKALTVVEEELFQWERYCCNFDQIEPCCRFGYGVTDCVNEYMCFERVKGPLTENFTIIAVTSLIHAFFLFVVTIGAATIFGIMRYRDIKKQNKENGVKEERWWVTLFMC